MRARAILIGWQGGSQMLCLGVRGGQRLDEHLAPQPSLEALDERGLPKVLIATRVNV
jgi:hypothetical protein